MSSKGRGAPTDKRENYPTPPHVADCMIEMVRHLVTRSPRIMEPSAGKAVVASRLLPLAAALVADDGVAWHRQGFLEVVDPYDWPELERLVADDGAVWHREDFLKVKRSRDWRKRPGLIVGNPPFSKALEHIQHALYLLDDDGYLVFLLPSSFLHDGVRAELRQKHPPLIEVGLQERPSFSKAAGRGGGTDSVRYSVFVWDRSPHPARWGWPKVVARTGTPTQPYLDPLWAKVGRAIVRRPNPLSQLIVDDEPVDL